MRYWNPSQRIRANQSKQQIASQHARLVAEREQRWPTTLRRFRLAEIVATSTDPAVRCAAMVMLREVDQ